MCKDVATNCKVAIIHDASANEDAINTCIKNWYNVSPETANFRKIFGYFRAANCYE